MSGKSEALWKLGYITVKLQPFWGCIQLFWLLCAQNGHLGFLAFWGPNGLLFGLGQGSKTFFGSTHIAEQLLFSMLPWFLTFNVYLILGSFMAFWGPNGLFMGLG